LARLRALMQRRDLYDFSFPHDEEGDLQAYAIQFRTTFGDPSQGTEMNTESDGEAGSDDEGFGEGKLDSTGGGPSGRPYLPPPPSPRTAPVGPALASAGAPASATRTNPLPGPEPLMALSAVQYQPGQASEFDLVRLLEGCRMYCKPPIPDPFTAQDRDFLNHLAVFLCRQYGPVVAHIYHTSVGFLLPRGFYDLVARGSFSHEQLFYGLRQQLVPPDVDGILTGMFNVIPLQPGHPSYGQVPPAGGNPLPPGIPPTGTSVPSTEVSPVVERASLPQGSLAAAGPPPTGLIIPAPSPPSGTALPGLGATEDGTSLEHAVAAAEAELKAMDAQRAAFLGDKLAATSLGDTPETVPANVPPSTQASANPTEEEGTFSPASADGKDDEDL
jgi:hypothetical protein